MSATTELLTARWNDLLPVAGGPGINSLEAVIRLITGIPADTVITNGLGMNAACQLANKPLWARAANIDGRGVRLQNTGNGGADTLMWTSGDYVYFFRNEGTEGAPTWVPMGQMNINSGVFASSGVKLSVRNYAQAGFSHTPIAFGVGTEVYEDLPAYHNTGTNNSRILAPLDGRYFFEAWVHCLSMIPGETVATWFRKNGSLSDVGQTWAGSGGVLRMKDELSAGEYIELEVYHTYSGSPEFQIDFSAEMVV